MSIRCKSNSTDIQSDGTFEVTDIPYAIKLFQVREPEIVHHGQFVRVTVWHNSKRMGIQLDGFFDIGEASQASEPQLERQSEVVEAIRLLHDPIRYESRGKAESCYRFL